MQLVQQEMGLPARGGNPPSAAAHDGGDPPMTLFTVMAGTNIGTQPMPAPVARRYQSALDRALSRCKATLFAHGSVDASYVHDSGLKVRERALVRAGELPTQEVPSLRSALARTASAFDQESIGLLLHSPDVPSTVRQFEAFAPILDVEPHGIEEEQGPPAALSG